MSAWRQVELGQGLRIKHGWAFKGEHFRDTGEKIVLTPGNFHEGGGYKPKNGTEKFYDGAYPEQYLLKRGDVVTAMTEQAQGLLGSTATIPFDETFLHNQRIGLIEITDPEIFDLRYVYHLMNAPVVRRQLQATATGSKVRHTAPERIQAVRVEVPDVSVQQVIAGVLDALDALVENNRRRIAVLEEMARAIYREWFVKFRFPGHQDVPLVDSALGRVPEGWKASTCGDELSLIGGGTPSKREPLYWAGGEVPWYTPSDLTKTGWRYAAEPGLRITELGLAKSSARYFPAGSVLMTSRATLGVLAVATVEGATNQGFITIFPDERWSSGFIREWLSANEEALSALGTGATFKEITKGSFKRFPFLVPSRDVLESHSAVTEPLECEIRTLERQVRRLGEIRDLLLPKLVTGRIDVSRLDRDAVMAEEVAR